MPQNPCNDAERYAIESPRKTYAAPHLTVHGSFRELTLKNGASVKTDSSNGNNNRS